MADITEITKIVRDSLDNKVLGLSTKLIFDEPMKVGNHMTFTLMIETCNTPQDNQDFYHTFVSNMGVDEELSFALDGQQCNKSNYFQTHIEMINKYKERYLKQEGGI